MSRAGRQHVGSPAALAIQAGFPEGQVGERLAHVDATLPDGLGSSAEPRIRERETGSRKCQGGTPRLSGDRLDLSTRAATTDA